MSAPLDSRSDLSRRDWIKIAGLAASSLSLGTAMPAAAAPSSTPYGPFRFCLNMSTIRGQKLTLEQEIDLAAKAGYSGIEPWINEIENAVSRGVSLGELRKRIDDAGLRVESAIGFAKWLVNDDAERAKGLEQLKRDMEMVKALGGAYIAAPPSGMQNADAALVDVVTAGERYRAALEVGDAAGVTPMVEVWGFSRNLSRLGDSVGCALESAHPKACVLTDVYHIHKGGSDSRSLRMLSGKALPVMHMNDYPDRPRKDLSDADRVYPGDGVAPLTEILRILRDVGFNGSLSLELFNRDYWKQDAMVVAKTGLEKMQAAVAKALAG
ncbi:Inosose isomerase [Caulifigura coniformis]|uniref:Inosose isomerase n=1 Tax=Caulifigura coniformis TaxID=2527983 RepID=A0A517SF28_9PLAN|nr:sugar phosphate isomerase/epimerase family protein [Caulifigura coniformis]QDT54690.1 Inosose isomerase [Caulifigura coniformis]